MAIHTDFRVTDDEGEIASISVYRDDDTIVVNQEGNEISFPPGMARELIQALTDLIDE